MTSEATVWQDPITVERTRLRKTIQACVLGGFWIGLMIGVPAGYFLGVVTF